MSSIGEKLDDYRVSTITCNAKVGVTVDMNKFFDNVNIVDLASIRSETDSGCIWVEFGKNTRGVYPKPRKELGAERKCFDNQVTVIYKLKTYFPNIKVFRNGSIQMTGIRTKEDGELACSQIAQEIDRMQQPQDPENTARERVKASEFTVRMINCDFGVPYKVKRKKLHTILISADYNNVCSFQPVDYPGVKLQYYWNNDEKYAKNGVCRCPSQCFGKGTSFGQGQCKKVTVSIFDSGKILITGANSFYQVNSAYRYIRDVIKDNEDDVKKIVPCIE